MSGERSATDLEMERRQAYLRRQREIQEETNNPSYYEKYQKEKPEKSKGWKFWRKR